MKAMVPVLIIASFFPSFAASEDCIDYGDYLHWAGGVAVPGHVNNVITSGSNAYVIYYNDNVY